MLPPAPRPPPSRRRPTEIQRGWSTPSSDASPGAPPPSRRMESSEVLRLDAEPELSLVAVDGAVPEEHGHLVNWAELQIEEWLDDEGEGRMELIDEVKVYCLLGLRTEDDDGQSVANATSNNDAVPDVGQATADNSSTVPDVGSSGAAIPDIDTRGAAIPVDDAIPEETVCAAL
ncbi:unnamed protein product [Urochloa humidicola]